MAISTKDISVIIQGPVIGKENDPVENQLTKRCIKSIRKHLPGAEIIISTWEGQDTEYLDKDKVVYSDDPGAITYNDFELKNTFNNNNRQIVSTFNGLKASTRKYSVKMRGDFYLVNAGFLDYFGKYTSRYAYTFLKERIIVPTFFFRDPEKVPLLYHISDLFMAGLTEDLLDLWNIPLQPEPQTTRAFDYSTQFANDPYPANQYKMKCSSEQYIWYAFSKKKGLDLSISYFCEVPFNLISKTVASTIDNFIILSPEQIGLVFPERLMHGHKQLYSFKKWQRLYQAISVKKSRTTLLAIALRVKLKSARYVYKNLKKKIKGKK